MSATTQLNAPATTDAIAPTIAALLAASLGQALAVIDSMRTQINQMKGFFDDSDGTLLAALSDADHMDQAAADIISRYEAEKTMLPAAVVVMDSGLIVDVSTNQPMDLLFIDYDTEGVEEDRLSLVKAWPPRADGEGQDIAYVVSHGQDDVQPACVNARLATWKASDGAMC